MIVRKIKDTELKEAYKLYEESFKKEVKTSNYSIDNLYVVSDNNEILGLCSIDYIDDVFKDKRKAYINSVCVSTKHRNKGIASFMMKEIEKICKEDGATQIMLTSNPKREEANNLYKKLEYDIYDTNVYRKDI